MTIAGRSFPAMATTVTVQLVRPGAEAQRALDRAEQVFRDVESTCTRFDASSDLMRANSDPRSWHEVAEPCFLAIREAAAAHRRTAGRFDPRVLRALVASGYDRTLPFRAGPVALEAAPEPGKRVVARGPWRPEFDEPGRRVRLGADPIDLGGIGKGLAVRWALEQLADAADSVLVEAGGDIAALGDGPEGEGWLVGVEDPRGGDGPLAVLSLGSEACATSSVRVRQWTVGGRSTHHIIDPRTGRAAESGLLSVTVVAPDPADAETWSKSLFLVGRGGLRHFAEQHGLAALWVDSSGLVGVSRDMKPHLVWQAPNEY